MTHALLATLLQIPRQALFMLAQNNSAPSGLQRGICRIHCAPSRKWSNTSTGVRAHVLAVDRVDPDLWAGPLRSVTRKSFKAAKVAHGKAAWSRLYKASMSYACEGVIGTETEQFAGLSC